jgi:hypothetical protein
MHWRAPKGILASDRSRLLAIKLLHSIAWLFFAGCIVVLPVLGALRLFRWAAIAIGAVLLECAVLSANRWRCPLTDWAARYARDRSPNFDIFLPRWLAEHNKTIFGILFVLNGLIVLGEWIYLAR